MKGFIPAFAEGIETFDPAIVNYLVKLRFLSVKAVFPEEPAIQ